MIAPKTTLVFVYNADSGLFSAVSDFVKKIVAPDTYECNLCMVTYEFIKMKNSWKYYLETIPNKKLFLHRDEFLKKFPDHAAIPLPVILIQDGDDLNILVSAEEINTAHDILNMKKLLRKKIEEYL